MLTADERCGIMVTMAVQQLIDDKPCLLSEGDFVMRCGWSSVAVAESVAAGSLFPVTQSGPRLYPSFFFDSTYDRRQLVAVTKLLESLGGFTKWQFFTTSKGLLGGVSPLAALCQGKFASVKRTAEGAASR